MPDRRSTVHGVTGGAFLASDEASNVTGQMLPVDESSLCT
jgi:NAD(P)-dependent dehydrogenase (short-subunit alcohol dehydrogenase family)